MTGPVFVVATDPATAAAHARAGRRVLEVRDAETAATAALAALDGTDLVLCCTADDGVVDALVDDLGHLGTVRFAEDAPPELHPEGLELLRLLQAGATLGAAAAELHLSRRTADRRLAEARRALGAGSTPEALVVAARRGLLGSVRE